MGIGFLLFISNFFDHPRVSDVFTSSGPTQTFSGPGTPPMSPDPFNGMRRFEDQMQTSATRGILGMLCMIGGGVLMIVGRAGFAGSGLVLDPKQARKDLEPWNRAAGGMIEDTLEEIPIVTNAFRPQPPPVHPSSASPVVKIRCRECQALNDETDKFCGQCGKPL